VGFSGKVFSQGFYGSGETGIIAQAPPGQSDPGDLMQGAHRYKDARMPGRTVWTEMPDTEIPEPVPGVGEYLSAYSGPVREGLLELRKLVFQVAAEDPRIGPLTETLKWGEPSYLTAKTRAGTTLRLAVKKAKGDRLGVFFHCQTRLAGRIEELYPEVFEFDGKRGLLFVPGAELPVEAVKGAIALVLTYHLNPLLVRS
jgi:hypothetical protein